MSVVTNDRLQRFNEILGLQSPGAREAAANLANLEMEDVAENSEVPQNEDQYQEGAVEGDEAENRDEVGSMVAKSSVSRAGISTTSSVQKSYISKLEKKLEEEKMAREKLEQEVEEMKKINAEISSKLGLSNTSASGFKTE